MRDRSDDKMGLTDRLVDRTRMDAGEREREKDRRKKKGPIPQRERRRKGDIFETDRRNERMNERRLEKRKDFSLSYKYFLCQNADDKIMTKKEVDGENVRK